MTTQLDLLSSSFRQYVVSPLNAFGLGGFVFDVEGDTANHLDADITDHYLEDNASAQDHIALKPIRITLKRYVGEVVHQQDDSIVTEVQQVVRKLTIVSSLLPTLSRAASQLKDIKLSNLTAQSALKSVQSKTVNELTDYWAFVKNLSGMASRQQQAYLYLKALRQARVLVSLQTPFEFLNNMAIENIVAIQKEGERFVSDFTITLKQLRFSSLVSVPSGTVAPRAYTNNTPNNGLSPSAPVSQERAALQAAPVRNNGPVPGTVVGIPKSEKEWTDAGMLAPPRGI